MQKSLFVLGLAVLLFGTGVFVLFVLPQIGGGATGAARESSDLSQGLNLLAVAVSSLGLAAGSALVGIGLGRWKRPKSSPHDGSPEI
jgi:hypothetical protein